MKRLLFLAVVTLALVGSANSATLDLKPRAKNIDHRSKNIDQLATLIAIWNPTIDKQSIKQSLLAEARDFGVRKGLVQPAILLADFAALSGRPHFAKLFGPIISELDPVAAQIVSKRFPLPRSYDELGFESEELGTIARRELPFAQRSFDSQDHADFSRLEKMDRYGLVAALMGPGSFIHESFEQPTSRVKPTSPIYEMSSPRVRDCISKCSDATREGAKVGAKTLGVAGAIIGATIGGAAGAPAGAVGVVFGGLKMGKEGGELGAIAGGALGAAVGLQQCAAKTCAKDEAPPQSPPQSEEPKEKDEPLETGPETPTAGSPGDDPQSNDDPDHCKHPCNVARVSDPDEGLGPSIVDDSAKKPTPTQRPTVTLPTREITGVDPVRPEMTRTRSLK